MRKWFFIVLPITLLFVFLAIDYFISSAEHTYWSMNRRQPLGSDNSVKKLLEPSFLDKEDNQSDSGRDTKANTPLIMRVQKTSHSGGNYSRSEEEGGEAFGSFFPSYKEPDSEARLGLLSLNLPVVEPTPDISFTVGASPFIFFSLKFVNEQVLEHDFQFKNIPVGGLSALSYDPEKDIFVALSDDKGQRGPPRFYELQLNKMEKGKRYELKIKAQVFLHNRMGRQLVPVDPEGISFFESDRIFISSEGVQMPGLTAPPAVFLFDSQGKWLSSLPIPDIYWPEDSAQLGKWGVKENKAFEALAVDPEQNQLWLATESSLHQDEKLVDNSENKKYIRISRFDINTKNIDAQFMYQMESGMEIDQLKGTNGLTDFFYLGEEKLLVVERAYLKDDSVSSSRKTDANLVRLFLTDCSMASDILHYKELQGGQYVTCGKTLLADLSAVLGDAVDNIEGITIGPAVSEGNRLLVLVSDNNFSRSQKTQFLFFHYSLDANSK